MSHPMMMTRFALSALVVATLGAGCTAPVSGQFRLAQLEETLGTTLDINTKLDLLWVVDNSASMDTHQAKLRAGFDQFARTYMQPTWDIRSAVITTDSFLAHSAFSGAGRHLDQLITGAGGGSAHITANFNPWTNPAGTPGLWNNGSHTFPTGVRYRDMVPVWGANYAKLMPGKHDGPIPALCYEGHAYFLRGITNCAVRDVPAAPRGIESCVRPTGGQSSITQCVNTVQNDTVRSGKVVIETMPPAGTPGDAAWVQGLVDAFTVNLTVGASGHGSERALQSLKQFLDDNERIADASLLAGQKKLFRGGSLRVVIFVGDEDDQSLTIPGAPGAGFSPWDGYTNGATCDRNVNGYAYRLTTCAVPGQLIPVATFKTDLDSFFRTLDGDPAGSPNYLVHSIVPISAASVQQLQADRVASDNAVGNNGNVAVDRPDRLIALGDLVGNGSEKSELSSADYSPILTAIGNAIIAKKGTFTLRRAPTGTEEMIVRILHADGSASTLAQNQYSVSGTTLLISDVNVVLSFKSTDRISLNYQPSSVF